MSRQAEMAARAAQNGNVNQVVTTQSSQPQPQSQSQPANNQQGQRDQTFAELEGRLSALELTIASLIKQQLPTGQQANIQPTAGRQPDTQQTSQAQPTLEVLPLSKPGYTGKAKVFFIHGDDGKINEETPFYSPNVAANFDKGYKPVAVWVENGIYVRPLTPAESANVVL